MVITRDIHAPEVQSIISKLSYDFTRAERLALAWLACKAANLQNGQYCGNGRSAAYMLYELIYIQNRNGSRQNRLNRLEVWDIVCMYLSGKGGAA